MKLIPKIVALLEKKAFAVSILAKLYSNHYSRVIEKEIKLAGITSNDRVLNVGCGGIPFTAIAIARHTGASVFAIDCDKEAVEAANRCIELFGMQDQVTAACIDGTAKIPFDYSVALVALQAEPKLAILKNLFLQARQDARLIFRKPRPELAHHYDLLPEKPEPCKAISQNEITFDYSVLYSVSTGETLARVS